MTGAMRTSQGGRVDRSRVIGFQFDGQRFEDGKFRSRKPGKSCFLTGRHHRPPTYRILLRYRRGASICPRIPRHTINYTRMGKQHGQENRHWSFMNQ